MQRKIIMAMIAMSMVGTACAQVPPPPATPPAAPSAAMQSVAGVVPNASPYAAALSPGVLPPLPPGCVTPAPPIPAPPAQPMYTGNAMQTALGISASQAAQVRQVFQQQAEQVQRIDEQRRSLDASTCQKLHAIVGDQGFARWTSATLPPGR